MNTFVLPFALAAILASELTPDAHGETYSIVDLGTLGTQGSVATGINANGQVSGYSLIGTNAAHGWRYTSSGGLTDLGSFGGIETRAYGINNAGLVTGYSTTDKGEAHGFVSNGGGLTNIGGFGGNADVFPQHINNAGQIAGFSFVGTDDRPFLFTPPNLSLNLGILATETIPATAAAYGVNDLGRVVGIGTGSNGLNRAFRSTKSGKLEELGTLGGDESWAYAINNAGQVVGSASFISTDTHAFLFDETTGMSDLGTLGGYTSAAFALNSKGLVVGTAELTSRESRAFVWSSSEGMRDLNEFIPVNAGWILSEARGVNDSGQIVGSGLLNGKPSAFLLTPNSGPDTRPPVAHVIANNITNIQYSAHLFQIVFSDDTSVLGSSIQTNAVRVKGPNGFDQLATLYPPSPNTNAVKLQATFFVTQTNGIWNGTNNGLYTVAIEPNTISDTLSNMMPAGVIGTFTVATEIEPLVSIIQPSGGITMATPALFTLTGLSSFPYSREDVFNFTIDWKNDGTEVETLSSTNGMQILHTFAAIGPLAIKLTATDGHGVASGDVILQTSVNNPNSSQIVSAGPTLTGSRRLAIGLNQNGTLVCLGGLPLKSGRDIVTILPPGASAFTDGQRMPSPTLGLGAGIDPLNRIVVFGGIEPGASTPNMDGFVYTTGGGGGAKIAAKHVAVHDFAFASDDLHRLYSIGGATGASGSPGTDTVERYDAAANAWTVLAPLPEARVGATACYNGQGHIMVFGGIEPTSGLERLTVFSYDIAANSWSRLSDAAIGTQAGRVAVLGADRLIYLIGSASSTQIFVFDSLSDSWFNGPSLLILRSAPAVALGNDGFVYVMGGDNNANGNNGLATTEKFDTGTPSAPRIVSSPSFFTSSLQAESTFSYKVIASGSPRPVLSLVNGPDGMAFDPATGLMMWTPTTNQVGNHTVLVRAASSTGVAEQTFGIHVTPLPGDVTPPSTPESLSLVFRSSKGVTLTWPAATDNLGVTSYNIYGLFRGSRSSQIGLMQSGITNRSYITRGFASAYYVAAVDAAGNISGRSAPTSNNLLTLPTIGPLNFGLPSTIIQGNAFLTTLGASANPSAGFSTLTGPPGMTFTHVAGPLPNADYVVVQWQPTASQVGTNFFTVAATNLNTTGSSALFTVVVLPNGTDFVAPTPVAQMTAREIGFDHIALDWTPAGDNIGIANYHIVATHFGATSNQVLTLNIPGANTNALLSGLLPASGYTIVITPSDAAGNIGGSTSIFASTSVRPNLSLALTPGVTPGTLMLTWAALTSQSLFIVESSDSLTTPNWQPIAPATQWPIANTSFVTTPDGSARFYRLISLP